MQNNRNNNRNNRNNTRRPLRRNLKDKVIDILTQYNNNEIDLNEAAEKLSIREQIPNTKDENSPNFSKLRAWSVLKTLVNKKRQDGLFYGSR